MIIAEHGRHLKVKYKQYLMRMRPLWTLLRSSETTIGIALAIFIGLLAGLGAVAFLNMIKVFQWLFFNWGADVFDFLGKYRIILFPAIGGLIVGILIHFLAREARGDGPPEVMKAAAVKGGRMRPRVAAVKALTSSIFIGSGGSVGREGPIIQIGASFGSTIGQWLRLPEDWMRTMLLCGAAGGISAMFNAPIGGVIFSIEVIQRRFTASSLGLVIISSVTASFIAHSFLGDTPSFAIPSYTMASNWEIISYLILGIISGLMALVFIRFFFKSEDFFSILKMPEYIKPMVGGLIVGIIGVWYFDILGVGYGGSYGPVGLFLSQGTVDKALIGEIGMITLLILMVLKMIATSISLGSGGSGGTFAPSLFIGATLGGAFGIIVHWLFPTITPPSEAASSGAYALVGMGAFFAAVSYGPITAIILLWEMTGNYTLILPLMTAVVVSVAVIRGFNRNSIYMTALIRHGVDIHREEESDLLRGIAVGEVMTRDYPVVYLSTSISDLMDDFHQSGHHGFPVLDEKGYLCGVVTLHDAEEGMSRKTPALTVADIATKSLVVAYPDQSVRDAMAQLGGRDVGRIPVVDRNDPNRLLGVLRRHDVVRAYTKAVDNRAIRRNSNERKM